MAALIPRLNNYSFHHCIGGNDYYDGASVRSCVFHNLCHKGSEPDVFYYYIDKQQPQFPVMSDNNEYEFDWNGQELLLGVYDRFSFKWSPRTVYEAKPDFPYDTAERAYFYHSFVESNPGHFLDVPHTLFVQPQLHGYNFSTDIRLIDSVKSDHPNEKNRQELLATISKPKPIRSDELGNICFKTLFAGAGTLSALEANHVAALTAEKFRDAVLKGFDREHAKLPLPKRHKIVIIQKNPNTTNKFNRFNDHDKVIEFLTKQFEGIAEVENMIPDKLSWKEQVVIIQSATIVLSTAGGGSYVAMFAREGATVIISDRNFKGPSKRDPATVGKDDNWWTQFHSFTSMHYMVCGMDECDGDVWVIYPRMLLTVLVGMRTAERYPLTDAIPHHLRIETIWRRAIEMKLPMPPREVCTIKWKSEILPDLQAVLKDLTASLSGSTSSSSSSSESTVNEKTHQHQNDLAPEAKYDVPLVKGYQYLNPSLNSSTDLDLIYKKDNRCLFYPRCLLFECCPTELKRVVHTYFHSQQSEAKDGTHAQAYSCMHRAVVANGSVYCSYGTPIQQRLKLLPIAKKELTTAIIHEELARLPPTPSTAYGLLQMRLASDSEFRVLFLVQGESHSDHPHYYLSGAVYKDVIFLNTLNWMEGDLFCPKCSFGEGRQALYMAARQLELAQGWLYNYYIFMEDDVSTTGGSVENFVGMLKEFQPASAVPQLSNSQDTISYHYMAHAVHREAVEVLFPWVLEYESDCWWSGNSNNAMELSLAYRNHMTISSTWSISVSNIRKNVQSCASEHGALKLTSEDLQIQVPSNLRHCIVPVKNVDNGVSLSSEPNSAGSLVKKSFGVTYHLMNQVYTTEGSQTSARHEHGRYAIIKQTGCSSVWTPTEQKCCTVDIENA